MNEINDSYDLIVDKGTLDAIASGSSMEDLKFGRKIKVNMHSFSFIYYYCSFHIRLIMLVVILRKCGGFLKLVVISWS